MIYGKVALYVTRADKKPSSFIPSSIASSCFPSIAIAIHTVHIDMVVVALCQNYMFIARKNDHKKFHLLALYITSSTSSTFHLNASEQ